MVRRLELNLLRATSVCVFRFVYTLPLGRNSELKKISSDFDSNSFAILSRISEEDIIKEDQKDGEESLTHKLTSRIDATWRFDRVIQIFEGKIAQLCALIKSTIFNGGNSNFEIVYFKRYILILCGKLFRFIGTLKPHFLKSFCEVHPNEKEFKLSNVFKPHPLRMNPTQIYLLLKKEPCGIFFRSVMSPWLSLMFLKFWFIPSQHS